MRIWASSGMPLFLIEMVYYKQNAMKKSFFLFSVLLTSLSFSQGTPGISELNNVQKESLFLTLMHEDIDLGMASLVNPSHSHHVFIEQVGSYNVVETEVLSENSNLELNQYGNENTILIDVLSKSTTGEIIQTGNHNYSFDFAHDPAQEVNLDLIQNGNGHHFERHGSNSIGNNLKFNMTGESQTIIVRNFK